MTAKPGRGTGSNAASSPAMDVTQISKAFTEGASQAAQNLQSAATSALASATPLAVLNSTGRTVATWANATQRITNRVQNLGNTVVQATDDWLANAADATSLQGISGQITQGASSLLPSAVTSQLPLADNLQGVQRSVAAGTAAILGSGSSSNILQQGLAQAANTVTANVLKDGLPVVEQDPPDEESPESSSFTWGIPADMLSIGLPKDATAGSSTSSSSAPVASVFQRASSAAAPVVDGVKAALSTTARTIGARGPVEGPRFGLQNAKVEILPNSPLAGVVPRIASSIADSPLGAAQRAFASAATNALASGTTTGQAPGPAAQQDDKPPDPSDEFDAKVTSAIASQTRSSLLAGSDAPAEAPKAQGPVTLRDADDTVSQAIAAGANQGLHTGSALSDDSGKIAPQDSSVYRITSPKTAKGATAGYLAVGAQEGTNRLAAANQRMAAAPAYGQIVSERQADGSARLVWAGGHQPVEAPSPSASDQDAVVDGEEDSETEVRSGLPTAAAAVGASSKRSRRSLKAKIIHEVGAVAATLQSTVTDSGHGAPAKV